VSLVTSIICSLTDVVALVDEVLRDPSVEKVTMHP
jgi:hypothetical protein